MEVIPQDLASLHAQFAAIERDADDLVRGLDQATGTWRTEAGSWSIAECLDHLATGNRVYLDAMRPPARRALAAGRRRRGPARPGLVGGWFVRSLEPPARRFLRMSAPRLIHPKPSPSLERAAEHFFASHAAVVEFLHRYGNIDLSGTTFPNPFIRGVRFSLATGLHVLAAHERRHLWQARRVQEAAARALVARPG